MMSRREMPGDAMEELAEFFEGEARRAEAAGDADTARRAHGFAAHARRRCGHGALAAMNLAQAACLEASVSTRRERLMRAAALLDAEDRHALAHQFRVDSTCRTRSR
jgi:hypothetical protein